MSKKTVAFTGLAALVAGVVIGSSGTEQAAVAEPKIKTVTETVEVEVTPQGCLDAIEAGETIMGDEVPKFADITISFIGLVQRAAKAGMNMDAVAMGNIAEDVDGLTKDTQNINAELTPLVRDFKAGRAECKAAR